ncbi:MAG TPA: NAD-binding protein, partial [Armatimonadota bacterium]|nr:NAD-binding protein [Armatimonadota bacterium]
QARRRRCSLSPRKTWQRWWKSPRARGYHFSIWEWWAATTYANHVIVCGVGRLGYRIIQQLLECGEEVVAVERDKQVPFLEKIRIQHVPVILSNACDPEALRQAGVAHARSIIPCTEDDLTNLEIALNAEEANPRIKIVLRMFEPELAKKVEKGFGFQTALSTSALAAPAFAAAATQTGVMHAFTMDHTMLYVAQTAVSANSTLIGQTVSQLERDFDLSVILHQRKAKVDLHPGPETVLQDGDRLVLFATLDVLTRFRKQFFDR